MRRTLISLARQCSLSLSPQVYTYNSPNTRWTSSACSSRVAAHGYGIFLSLYIYSKPNITQDRQFKWIYMRYMIKALPHPTELTKFLKSALIVCSSCGEIRSPQKNPLRHIICIELTLAATTQIYNPGALPTRWERKADPIYHTAGDSSNIESYNGPSTGSLATVWGGLGPQACSSSIAWLTFLNYCLSTQPSPSAPLPSKHTGSPCSLPLQLITRNENLSYIPWLTLSL